jgi:hypothetical protein
LNLKGVAAAAAAASLLSVAPGGGLPEGWAQSATLDAARACQAQRSPWLPGAASRLTIRCAQATEGALSVTQTIDAAPYRGQRLELSARLRAEGLAGRVGLLLRSHGADQRVLALDDMRLRPVSADSGWVNASVLLDVAEEAQTVTLGVLLERGPGRAAVEGLRFERVDPQRSGLAIIHRPEATPLPAQPRNLGLE